MSQNDDQTSMPTVDVVYDRHAAVAASDTGSGEGSATVPVLERETPFEAVSSASDPVDSPALASAAIQPDIDALTAAVDRLSQQVAADRDIIGRMQSRIEELQGDQVRALLSPAVTELANLLAEFSEASVRDYERLGLDRVRREFALLSDHIEVAIDHLGATSLDVHVGDTFDSRIHQAVKKVPTSDSTLDKTVAAVVRQGFTFDPAGKPALYARVRVNSYEPLLEMEAFRAEPTPEPIAQAIPVIPPRPADPVWTTTATGTAADDLDLPFPL